MMESKEYIDRHKLFEHLCSTCYTYTYTLRVRAQIPGGIKKFILTTSCERTIPGKGLNQ